MDILGCLQYYQDKGFMLSFYPNGCFSVGYYKGWDSLTQRYAVAKEVISLKEVANIPWQEVEAVLDLFLESVEEGEANA